MAFKTFDNFAIVLTPGYNEPLNDVDIQLLKSLITKDRNELHITENEGIGYKHSLDILYEIDYIKTLMLNNYNKKITKLPKNLVNFYTGNAFNQSINNLVLPDSIEKLVLGSNFNKIIEKFPSNLRYLEFGRRFNKPLTNLPDGLKSLYLNGEFNFPLDNLPKSLRFLSLTFILSAMVPMGFSEVVISAETTISPLIIPRRSGSSAEPFCLGFQCHSNFSRIKSFELSDCAA